MLRDVRPNTVERLVMLKSRGIPQQKIWIVLLNITKYDVTVFNILIPVSENGARGEN